MSQTKIQEIRCTNCQVWFRSPIFFGDSSSFDTSTLIGNSAQCPKCGKMTGCNKENMRIRFDDNTGFVGKDV